jgi:hypothetical protein
MTGSQSSRLLRNIPAQLEQNLFALQVLPNSRKKKKQSFNICCLLSPLTDSSSYIAASPSYIFAEKIPPDAGHFIRGADG